MSANTLSSIHASLMRFCMDFIEANPGLEWVNFDDHANSPSLPAGDLMGPSSLTIEFADKLIQLDVMFGIGVDDDVNLFKLNAYIGRLLELVLPEKRIRVYDADTGYDIGWFIVQNGTRLLPVGNSDAKPIQFIQVSLLSGMNFQVPQ